MPRCVEIQFAVPREVAFDYLVDPHNRVQWQSTLRFVEDVEPMPPETGTSWRERTLGGAVSQMRLTAVERPTMWAEVGKSRGLSMNLTLVFEEAPGGCLVVAEIQFVGRGPWRVVAAVASRVFPYGARHDLTRAARILGGCTRI